MSSPSISASVNYNDKRKSKDLRYRTHNTDLLNLDENKFDYRKNCQGRKKCFEILKSEICTKSREIKRAQEQRIDEVSVQKLRENHETILQLTSQLQLNARTDEMNSTNDSGDFQDVGSNYCLCSAVTNDCRLTHGINLEYRKTFFENPFSTFDSPREYPRRVQSHDVEINREAALEAGKTKTVHTSEDRQNEGTIPMPTFATKQLTASSTIPVELPQNYMVGGQQRQQISELQYDKFPTTSSFLCWEIRFKNQVTTCSDFPSEAMVWIKQRSRDGRFIG